MNSNPAINPRRFTLPNGLRVVHNFDPSTAMVAVDVLYDTGARDESPELTGLAHLFEHLMFGGSANVPDFDIVLQNAGGNSNAWTTNDFTNFYDTLPAQNVETAFYLESDRMLALSFSAHSLEVQRGVVIEEFKERVLNQPFGDIYHFVRSGVYGSHPYSWPTIGLTPEHIGRVTMDAVRKWFYAHYAPNNAILSVSGNVTFERVRELAHKWFGPIPSREIELRHVLKFEPADVVPLQTVRRAVPYAMLIISYPMAAYGREGYNEADVISDVLASGKASRLYRRLIAGRIADGLFTAADASIMGSEDTGLFMFTAQLSRWDEPDLELAEKILRHELEMMSHGREEGGPTETELQRAFNRFETSFRLRTLSYLNVATELAIDEFHGENINERVALRRKITPSEVARTAGMLVDGPSSVVRYIPVDSNTPEL